MTSHTDSAATHTLDSDLIDEPSPAHAEAHMRTHSSVRRSQWTHHHHTSQNGPRQQRSNDIGESDD